MSDETSRTGFWIPAEKFRDQRVFSALLSACTFLAEGWSSLLAPSRECDVMEYGPEEKKKEKKTSLGLCSVWWCFPAARVLLEESYVGKTQAGGGTEKNRTDNLRFQQLNLWTSDKEGWTKSLTVWFWSGCFFSRILFKEKRIWDGLGWIWSRDKKIFKKNPKRRVTYK